MPSETEIRPFRADMPGEAIADLRQRIAATRWPSRELVADRSQGVRLATIQELVGYWTTGYDWRAFEAALNALPQFTTEIDGENVHFIHVRSRHQGALPLVITQGWPGSIIGLLGVVGPLPTRPRAAAPPGTRSTWYCHPCPATAFPPCRPSWAGTSAASPEPGQS